MKIIGSGIASPTDRIKILFQAEAGRINSISNTYETGLRIGHSPSYGGKGIGPVSTFRAFYSVFKEEGLFLGLYKGALSTVVRASLLAGAQLATYDHTKYLLSKEHKLMEEGVGLHLVASVSAALAATTASQPADLIKSRMMSDKDCKFRGTFDCIKYTLRNDGFLGFFRGWTPSFARLCPHFCISLPLFEQTRRLLGLSYL